MSDAELTEIRSYTGESKKGPVIPKLVIDALQLKRREQIAQKFISGEFSAELSGYEASRAADRAGAARCAKKWRQK